VTHRAIKFPRSRPSCCQRENSGPRRKDDRPVHRSAIQCFSLTARLIPVAAEAPSTILKRAGVRIISMVFVKGMKEAASVTERHNLRHPRKLTSSTLAASEIAVKGGYLSWSNFPISHFHQQQSFFLAWKRS